MDDSKDVDFNRSAFFSGDGWARDEQLFSAVCPSYEAYLSDEYNSLTARHVVFSEQFDRTKDIIYLNMMNFWTTLVSKRLITAIKEHRLTGLEFYEEQPVFFSDFD